MKTVQGFTLIRTIRKNLISVNGFTLIRTIRKNLIRVQSGFTLIRTIRKNLDSVNGFTLIELLITIVIIGILAGIVSLTLVNPPKLARDAERKSDIKQYQTALEAFANKQAGMLFPSRIAQVHADTLCATLGISGSCPQDPQTPTYDYYYISDGTGTPNNDASQYILWGYLEGPKNYFIVCSTGKTGTGSVPTGLPCPI